MGLHFFICLFPCNTQGWSVSVHLNIYNWFQTKKTFFAETLRWSVKHAWKRLGYRNECYFQWLYCTFTTTVFWKHLFHNIRTVHTKSNIKWKCFLFLDLEVIHRLPCNILTLFRAYIHLWSLSANRSFSIRNCARSRVCCRTAFSVKLHLLSWVWVLSCCQLVLKRTSQSRARHHVFW